jgi:hypothetical protein
MSLGTRLNIYTRIAYAEKLGFMGYARIYIGKVLVLLIVYLPLYVVVIIKFFNILWYLVGEPPIFNSISKLENVNY